MSAEEPAEPADAQAELRADAEEQIPGLKDHVYTVKSNKTRRYNCFAWAAGMGSKWWSCPPIGSGNFWPTPAGGGLLVQTLEGTARAYEAHGGYKECANGDLEDGVEKIALFVDATGEATHAARQLPSGVWVSKLGRGVDIEHDLVEAVSGRLTGELALFMSRHRQGPPPTPPEPLEIIIAE